MNRSWLIVVPLWMTALLSDGSRSLEPFSFTAKVMHEVGQKSFSPLSGQPSAFFGHAAPSLRQVVVRQNALPVAGALTTATTAMAETRRRMRGDLLAGVILRAPITRGAEPA